MSRHHKLVYGSLFVFFTATHVGCAGSGLKNMFTRNETDGYHSLDELEAEQTSGAETEISGVEVENPSMATRLTSWRPFSRTEPTEEEISNALDTDSSKMDSADAGKSPRLLGRAFKKRDSVEPDPFLSAEPKLAEEPESPSSNAIPQKKIAKIHDQSNKAEEEFVFEAGPGTKSAKDAVTRSRRGHRQSESTDDDTNAFALDASRKTDSSSSGDDEDEVLAERFEQHFLLSSTGTVAKTETETKAVATGSKLRQEVLAQAESSKRELSSIADRQINQFDFLLAADSDSQGNAFGSGHNADAESLKSSKRSASTAEKSGSSLAEFDQLMGTEDSDASHAETEVLKTAVGSSKKRASTHEIDVADAEALFGAAAARQNARMPQSVTTNRAESSDLHADGSSAWSQASENLEGFDGNESRQIKSGLQSDRNGGDVEGAFARHLSGISGHGKVRIHNTAFSAPGASAGNVEDDHFLSEESPDIRLSNASGYSNEHRIVTANYGTVQPDIDRASAAAETSTAGDAQLTATTVAPVSPQESISEVASDATRPGLVQSFSTRNWLLLIGGIIVIALLFAPGRTRPLTMNNRPANG